jgi:hypothetical protein
VTAQDISEVYRAEGEFRLRPHLLSEPSREPVPVPFPKRQSRPFTVPLVEIIPPPVLAALHRMVCQ